MREASVDGLAGGAAELDGLVGETRAEFVDGAVDDAPFLAGGGEVVECELGEAGLEVGETGGVDVVGCDAGVAVVC